MAWHGETRREQQTNNNKNKQKNRPEQGIA